MAAGKNRSMICKNAEREGHCVMRDLKEDEGLSPEIREILTKAGVRDMDTLIRLAETGRLDSIEGLGNRELIGILKRVREVSGASYCCRYFGD